MINERILIEEILQHENVLADANYYYKQGYDERQKEILNIIERQPVVDAEGVDAAYLDLVKEIAEMKKQLAADRWIPVEERLPECKINVFGKTYASDALNVTIKTKEGKIETSVDFMYEDGSWACAVGKEKVIAWKPLPNPYIPRENRASVITESGASFNKGVEDAMKDPCRNCFGAASNDCQGCWKSAMMDTFLGSRKGDVR